MQQRGKPVFKEKFVELSETIFKGETTFTNDPTTFWDTYFLLPINTKCIFEFIETTSEESLLGRRNNINSIFSACLERMTASDITTAVEQTRQINAIILLTCLVRALFKKKRLSQFNIIDLLTGLDKADASLGKLISALDTLLHQQVTKSYSLSLAITLSAGNDNVNQNSFNGYFMHHDLSTTLFSVIADDLSSDVEVRNATMLLAMLSNYNKYETRNPYLHVLSQYKQESVLEKLATIYTDILNDMTRKYQLLKDEDESITKSVVTYMSSWFPGSSKTPFIDIDNAHTLIDFPPADSAMLLLLYDLVNTNPRFISMITRSITKSNNNTSGNTTAAIQPFSKLLVSLLTFASYLFQHNRNDRSFVYTKLVMLILLRFCEETRLLTAMVGQETEQMVRLCRQRPPPLPKVKKPRFLLCAIIDDLVLFLKHNMRKKLDMATYKLSLSVMHRILSFLYKRRIRLDYHWTELWCTLTTVLHFTSVHLDQLKLKSQEFNPFLASLLTVFNMCVTHGEVFLHDTKSFDSLFYEIIRSSDDFMALSHYVTESSIAGKKGQTAMTTSSSDRSPPLSSNNFANIRTICNHFKPALEEGQVAQQIKYPSPDQVMALIQEHFATLTLAPMDKLEQFSPYTEIPNEMGYFRYLLRMVVGDYLTWTMTPFL
ncbi:uncharacterized protein BX664DRAFT_334428 [Halteromyces radiatus]|uniref:uncharacterized protein n=1 Tax=Halteromyces radiatus TaxID=101107 RepID=UPI0022203EED|nr:uncharacterized protein BX664DRAFT_334428 [Halteromyces radiatus]KAI8089999.1 hypothetical protein BX664DRAFT_334428 [Halteromyces radiatus]